MAKSVFIFIAALLAITNLDKALSTEEIDFELPMQTSPSPQPEIGVDDLKTIFPFITIDPKGCWNAITETQGCCQDIFQSLVSFHIQVSPACCKVIENIGESCFNDIFTQYPFSPMFAPLMKNFCGTSHESWRAGRFRVSSGE